MKLTKNERKVLRLLLENARISDSTIAVKLNISSQAVGKIRRKLEANLIESYTINLNYDKLGISTFAITLTKLSSKTSNQKNIEVEKKLLSEPHIIQAMRLPNFSSNYILLYGFKDMQDLDEFFNNQKKKKELHSNIENREFFTFSNSSILKNSSAQLYSKFIEDLNESQREKTMNMQKTV